MALMKLSPISHPDFSKCSLKNLTIGAAIHEKKMNLYTDKQRNEVGDTQIVDFFFFFFVITEKKK